MKDLDMALNIECMDTRQGFQVNAKGKALLNQPNLLQYYNNHRRSKLHQRCKITSALKIKNVHVLLFMFPVQQFQ